MAKQSNVPKSQPNAMAKQPNVPRFQLQLKPLESRLESSTIDSEDQLAVKIKKALNNPETIFYARRIFLIENK